MPSSGFRIQGLVGRPRGATEDFETEGNIIRSVFKENHSGYKIERGREEDSLKVVSLAAVLQSAQAAQPSRAALGGCREGPSRPPSA